MKTDKSISSSARTLPASLLAFLLTAVWSPFLWADPVLLALPLKDGDTALTAQVLSEVRGRLAKLGVKTIEAPEGISSSSAVLPSSSSRLGEALEKAHHLQLNLDEKTAALVVTQALEGMRHQTPSLKDLSLLGDAWLFLALCQKDEGLHEEMNKSLEEAARLNPTLTPKEMLYPPSLLKLFEQAKDRIWKTGVFSQLTIESDPAGSHVFVNGSFKGNTPLRLNRFPAGEHHVLVRDERGREDYRRIRLEGGAPSQVMMHPGSKAKTFSVKLPHATDLKAQDKWLSSLGYREAIGVGVADLGKGRLAGVINALAVKKMKSQAFDFDSSTSPETIAETLVGKSVKPRKPSGDNP